MSDTLTISTSLSFASDSLPDTTLTNTITLDATETIDRTITVASGGSSPGYSQEVVYDRTDSNLPGLNENTFKFLLIQCLSGEDADDITYVELIVDEGGNDMYHTHELRSGEWLLLQNASAMSDENTYSGGFKSNTGSNAATVDQIDKVTLMNKSSGTAAKFRVMASD